MPEIVVIKFDFNPKVYYFAPGEFDVKCGDCVVVETGGGPNFGTVALEKCVVDDKKIVGKLMPVIRVATKEDTEKHKKLVEKRNAAYPQIADKIRESGLEMKLVGAEYTFDGSKLIVYFTADGRVDFRNLVRDLASSFHTRIELKQIGARDECRMMGGIAPCGRACCCSDHMSEQGYAQDRRHGNRAHGRERNCNRSEPTQKDGARKSGGQKQRQHNRFGLRARRNKVQAQKSTAAKGSGRGRNRRYFKTRRLR